MERTYVLKNMKMGQKYYQTRKKTKYRKHIIQKYKKNQKVENNKT